MVCLFLYDNPILSSLRKRPEIVRGKDNSNINSSSIISGVSLIVLRILSSVSASITLFFPVYGVGRKEHVSLKRFHNLVNCTYADTKSERDFITLFITLFGGYYILTGLTINRTHIFTSIMIII